MSRIHLNPIHVSVTDTGFRLSSRIEKVTLDFPIRKEIKLEKLTEDQRTLYSDLLDRIGLCQYQKEHVYRNSLNPNQDRLHKAHGKSSRSGTIRSQNNMPILGSRYTLQPLYWAQSAKNPRIWSLRTDCTKDIRLYIREGKPTGVPQHPEEMRFFKIFGSAILGKSHPVLEFYAMRGPYTEMRVHLNGRKNMLFSDKNDTEPRPLDEMDDHQKMLWGQVLSESVQWQIPLTETCLVDPRHSDHHQRELLENFHEIKTVRSCEHKLEAPDLPGYDRVTAHWNPRAGSPAQLVFHPIGHRSNGPITLNHRILMLPDKRERDIHLPEIQDQKQNLMKQTLEAGPARRSLSATGSGSESGGIHPHDPEDDQLEAYPLQSDHRRRPLRTQTRKGLLRGDLPACD